jgi:flagellar M-ring protein FliF
MNKNPFEAVLSIFNRLSLQQKVILGGAVGLTLVVLSVLIMFFNEPTYAPLYTNLAEEDASKVIEHLTSQKIPYKIEDNGKTVKVPQDKVYETRLSLAGKGVLNSGIVGYELFDKTTMGMSEFLQKLNYKRALEGELAKTIMQEDGVEGVRVLITLPEKSVFKDEEKSPTASVMLKLKSQSALNKESVNAIINLVASSVEGLKTGKVTVLDTKGRLLSNEDDGDQLSGSNTKQYEMKQKVENYLARKAQDLLDNILGNGNAMVKVTADLNFDQVEKTIQTYDPESQVAISEQTLKTENNGRNLNDSSAQVNENTTTNYEISKSVEKIIAGTGNIKRLSVSAVINNIPKDLKKGDKTETIFEPRSTDQMKKLEQIVKKAIGIDDSRNDQFSIVNISFETKNNEDLLPQSATFIDNIDKWTNTIIIILAIGSAIFLLRGLMHKIKNEKILIGTLNPDQFDLYESSSTQEQDKLSGNSPARLIQNRKKELLPMGDLEDEITDDAQRKKIRLEKIGNYVGKNPVEAAKLINAWLIEEEY